jgi:insertion element IS1 protein InsB
LENRGKNKETLKEFLEEIDPDERDFVTDNCEACHQLIPEAQLRTGKDLTYPIEQDNSNARHYIGRFKRRTKTTSRCIRTVDLSMLLLYHVSTWQSFRIYAIRHPSTTKSDVSKLDRNLRIFLDDFLNNCSVRVV